MSCMQVPGRFTVKFRDRLMGSFCLHYHVDDCEGRQQMMRMVAYVRVRGYMFPLAFEFNS